MGFFDSALKGIASAFTGNPLGFVGSAIGIGKSLFGSNSSSQSSFNDKVLAANQAENEANRKFQREMSDLNYKRQMEMWNLNNEYNTPSAMRQRMVEAGFNPNLLTGVTPTASTMASVGSGSLGGSAGLPASGMSAPMPQNDSMSRAQIDLLRSQAEKNRKDISWVDRLNQSSVDLSNSKVLLNDNVMSFNDKQKEVLGAKLEKLNKECAILEEQANTQYWLTEGAKHDSVIKKYEAIVKENSFNESIQLLKNQLQLSELEIAQCAVAIQLKVAMIQTQGAERRMLDALAAKYSKEFEVLDAKLPGLRIQNDQIEFDFELHKQFAELEKWIGITGEGLGALQDLISLRNLIRGRKPSRMERTRYTEDDVEHTIETHR